MFAPTDRSVLKYTFTDRDLCVEGLSSDFVVRHVAFQRGKLCVWIETDTDPNAPLRKFFYAIDTGAEIPEGSEFCGTAMNETGGIVLHVYEEMN